MVKLSVAVAVVLATTVSAFAPSTYNNVAISSTTELSMANGERRKAALKTVKKVAGVAAAAAFATGAAPPAAFAAKKAAEVVETVEAANDLKKLVGYGTAAVAAGAAALKVSGGKGEAAQGFLEAEPYWDQSTVPVNVYKNKAPFTGKIVSTKRIVGPKATGETCHIVIDHEGDFPYWEGQSWGVIPPGNREKDGKPHSVRL
eukprot:CAMPEP_0178958626 /NCGR_PEP_ID=MMETSP0789-20121207/11746_1 /TAXON_ID=3005 /ORGANISM="Rhizosolenia setigera, Strain CCMP 1694" /LENGTH=201 /DNA_ID=CAMNT_0020641351 /DNA_START=142 /DNA_END=743 /DNA_ORIENTATION=-